MQSCTYKLHVLYEYNKCTVEVNALVHLEKCAIDSREIKWNAMHVVTEVFTGKFQLVLWNQI